MSRRDDVKAEFQKLVAEGRELVRALYADDDKLEFRLAYQGWYSKAISSLAVLAPDRLPEFRSYYEIDPKRKELGYGTYVIQDWFKGVAPSSLQYTNFNTKAQAAQCAFNQYTILEGVATRLDSVLDDITDTILADLGDSELTTATELLKASVRAAGALAGVVLEAHLGRVAEKHGTKPRKKHPTIADLNDVLKTAKVYDTPVWRKISFLGDLRNLCSHKKETEPTKENVVELIAGVQWAITNVF